MEKPFFGLQHLDRGRGVAVLSNSTDKVGCSFLALNGSIEKAQWSFLKEMSSWRRGGSESLPFVSWCGRVGWGGGADRALPSMWGIGKKSLTRSRTSARTNRRPSRVQNSSVVYDFGHPLSPAWDGGGGGLWMLSKKESVNVLGEKLRDERENSEPVLIQPSNITKLSQMVWIKLGYGVPIFFSNDASCTLLNKVHCRMNL